MNQQIEDIERILMRVLEGEVNSDEEVVCKINSLERLEGSAIRVYGQQAGLLSEILLAQGKMIDSLQDSLAEPMPHETFQRLINLRTAVNYARAYIYDIRHFALEDFPHGPRWANLAIDRA